MTILADLSRILADIEAASSKAYLVQRASHRAGQERMLFGVCLQFGGNAVSCLVLMAREVTVRFQSHRT